jgi:hypothetical protein
MLTALDEPLLFLRVSGPLTKLSAKKNLNPKISFRPANALATPNFRPTPHLPLSPEIRPVKRSQRPPSSIIRFQVSDCGQSSQIAGMVSSLVRWGGAAASGTDNCGFPKKLKDEINPRPAVAHRKV